MPRRTDKLPRRVKLQGFYDWSMAEILHHIELTEANIRRGQANIEEIRKSVESAQERLRLLMAERDRRQGG